VGSNTRRYDIVFLYTRFADGSKYRSDFILRVKLRKVDNLYRNLPICNGAGGGTVY